MGKPNTICEFCETVFYKRPSRKKLYRHHYCCPLCSSEDRKRRKQKERVARQTKICGGCQEEKPVSDFYLKDKESTLLQSVCINCTKKYHRAHYEENSDSYKDRSTKSRKRYKKRNHRIVFDYLVRHPCDECGCTDKTILQFHHIDEKDDEVGNLVNKGSPVERLLAEIEKCRVLCPNCHRKATLRTIGGHPFKKYGWL